MLNTYVCVHDCGTLFVCSANVRIIGMPMEISAITYKVPLIPLSIGLYAKHKKDHENHKPHQQQSGQLLVLLQEHRERFETMSECYFPLFNL